MRYERSSFTYIKSFFALLEFLCYIRTMDCKYLEAPPTPRVKEIDFQLLRIGLMKESSKPFMKDPKGSGSFTRRKEKEGFPSIRGKKRTWGDNQRISLDSRRLPAMKEENCCPEKDFFSERPLWEAFLVGPGLLAYLPPSNDCRDKGNCREHCLCSEWACSRIRPFLE